uniref:Sb:cb1058 n=1 Tax=Seriola lalandi dorsalis TaxID=1841481 RepID=A0A3B4YLH2_SERLL
MTIGKNSRKNSTRSSIRAPKFLDKSSGFYGRLDEPETTGEGEEVRANAVEERGSGVEDASREGRAMSSPATSVGNNSGADEVDDAEAFEFNEGLMEDDGETLLRRKPSRRSSRWRRSSRRKQALDRAFRRGWEAFITNLYSVTLTPVTLSSPPSPLSKKQQRNNSVLAE